MDADQKRRARRHPRHGHAVASRDRPADTAQHEGEDAGDQHRAEHEAQALEDLEIGVVRLLPYALDADRPVAVQRKDTGKSAISVTEPGSVEDRSQGQQIDRYPIAVIDAADGEA